MRRLTTGDIVWTCPWGTVGIEDKPLNTVLSDRRSGVLDDELRRLAETYAIPMLLIRGLPRVGRRGMMEPGEESFVAFDNLLLGRQMRGILVVWCPTRSLFGERVWRLYHYTQRPTTPSQVVQRRHLPWHTRLGDKARVIYTMLGLVRGIQGRARLAEQIAATTPLDEFARWSADQFQAVGLSKLMAGRLATVFAKMGDVRGS